MSKKRTKAPSPRGLRTKDMAGVASDLTASDITDEAQRSLRMGTDARLFREFHLFTGIADLDLFAHICLGSRLEILGNPNACKSLLCHILTGAFQKTCRLCYTPIIEWVADWDVLSPVQADGTRCITKESRKDWQTRLDAWAGGDTTAFKTKTTCLCGACESMCVLFVNTENTYNPYWAAAWGADVGDFSLYDQTDFKEDESGWTGLLIHKQNKFMICQPSSSAIVENVISKLIEKNVVDAVILDSVTSITTTEDINGMDRIASRARFLSRLWPLLLSRQMHAMTNKNARISIITTNQYRQNMASFPGANPNQASSGKAQRYAVDTSLDLGSSKLNACLGEKPKMEPHISRDVEFKFGKKRGSVRSRGNIRFFLDEYTPKSGLTYRTGDTAEPDVLWNYLVKMQDPGVAGIEERKSAKTYWVLGRPFERLRDVLTFLRRRDVQYQLRFILYAHFLSALERMNLRWLDFSYNPFDDHITEILRDKTKDTGDAVREVHRKTSRSPTDPERAEPAAVVEDAGQEPGAGSDE